MNKLFKLSELETYGVSVRVDDIELADEFEDFLTEDLYVFFDQKIEKNHVAFYFGQAGSRQKVAEFIELFLAERSSSEEG